MASLLAYNNLVKISDSFVGVASDAREDRVVVTYSNNMVILIRLKDNKQEKVWVLDKRPLLSSKVLFDHRLQMYVGVFGSKNLKLWTEETENVSKVKKTKLFREVQDLVEAKDGRVLILYKNSFCESVESALVSIERNQEGEHREIELQEVHQVTVGFNEKYGRYLSFFSREQDGLELSFVQLQEEDLQPSGSFRRIPVDASDPIVGYCVGEMQNKPQLLVFGESGRFKRTSIMESSNERLQSDFIGSLNIVNSEVPLSMMAISPDLVAIYASTVNLDGAILFLYNTEYKVVQSKQYFKVFFSNSQLSSVRSSVFLVAGQYLSVIPFKVVKDKLADLVGSQNQGLSESHPKVVLENCDGSELLLENLTFDESQVYSTKLKPVKMSTPKILPAIASEEAVEDEICEVFRDHFDVQVKEHCEVGAPIIQVFSNPTANFRLHEPVEVLISRLEAHGASEWEIAEKVFPLLLKNGKSQDLKAALLRFRTLPEGVLGSVLKHAIRGEERSLLNAVLACSFEHSALVSSLRTLLNLDESKNLLKVLLVQLKSDKQIAFDSKFDSFDDFDFDSRLLQWTTALVDAHYQQFLLSKDEEFLQIFEEWRKVLREREAAVRSLVNLRTLVHEVLRGRYGKVKKTNRWYNIERVTL